MRKNWNRIKRKNKIFYW